MDLKEIKELIALMRKNDLSVFKMEKEGFKITLKKGTDFQPVITAAASGALPAPAGAVVSVAGSAPTPAGPILREITSPMVGTFYGSATPESAPYVTVGQEITEETVVCIIEAMKVMNEIKAETRGVVAEIAAENGKPVQYGQALFKLK